MLRALKARHIWPTTVALSIAENRTAFICDPVGPAHARNADATSSDIQTVDARRIRQRAGRQDQLAPKTVEVGEHKPAVQPEPPAARHMDKEPAVRRPPAQDCKSVAAERFPLL